MEPSQHKEKPATKLLRLSEVLKILPVSKSTWWAGVKSGRYPQPVKLGPRVTCWRDTDLHSLAKNGAEQTNGCTASKND